MFLKAFLIFILVQSEALGSKNLKQTDVTLMSWSASDPVVITKPRTLQECALHCASNPLVCNAYMFRREDGCSISAGINFEKSDKKTLFYVTVWVDIKTVTIKPTQIMTKLLVLGGAYYPYTAEVVDYASPNTKCSLLTSLPNPIEAGFGGLGNFGRPEICGGSNNGQNCWVYNNGSWKISSSLTINRIYAASTNSPFMDPSQRFFTVGGYDQATGVHQSSIEQLTSSGWTTVMPSYPSTVFVHCIVMINATTLFSIGGYYANSATTSNTFFFKQVGTSFNWVAGPSLAIPRQEHSCARVLTILSGTSLSIIAAAGVSNGYVQTSTEKIDMTTLAGWSYGPSLPTYVWRAGGVEDLNGGILMVSGVSYTASIFRLKSLDSQWETLPQVLKYQRYSPVVMFIPTDLTTCV